jgi:NAD(P)-dependent dehydrogenase (short-subunit alcohol dehydrogenase family)
LVSSHHKEGTAARDEVAKRGNSADVTLLIADMSLQSSVRELGRQLLAEFPTINALIHQGVHHQIRKLEREVTAEGHERFWAHNHLGPFLLTHLLKDALVKGHGRVITIGSTRLKVYPRLTVYLDDPGMEKRSYSSTRAFYQSKLAQIQFAIALGRHWAGTGVVAKALSVPSVGVDPTRRGGLPWFRRLAHDAKGSSGLTTKKLGELYAVTALSPGVAKIPAVYLDDRLEEAWAPIAAFDPGQQDALWKLSMDSVGL